MIPRDWPTPIPGDCAMVWFPQGRWFVPCAEAESIERFARWSVGKERQEGMPGDHFARYSAGLKRRAYLGEYTGQEWQPMTGVFWE